MTICKICANKAELLGYLPFDTNNNNVPVIDKSSVTYFKCTNCYCIFCPEMQNWDTNTLSSKVYNEEYIKYDPEYANGVRAKDFGDFIKGLLPLYNGTHLDYGSGAGLLAKELKWNTFSYDPFSQNIAPSGVYRFITMIEVVEHSQDIERTLVQVLKYLDKKRGVIFLSTSLATKDTSISWPYIAPRNGHINIQSKKSMEILCKKYNMFFNSITENVHLVQSSRNNFKDLQRGTRW